MCGGVRDMKRGSLTIRVVLGVFCLSLVGVGEALHVGIDHTSHTGHQSLVDTQSDVDCHGHTYTHDHENPSQSHKKPTTPLGRHDCPTCWLLSGLRAHSLDLVPPPILLTSVVEFIRPTAPQIQTRIASPLPPGRGPPLRFS